MTIFEKQIAEGRILSKLPRWQRLVDSTKREMVSFIAAHSPVMLSLSWGKQSAVIAHMLHEMRLSIPCVFFREAQSELVADFDALSSSFMSRWPINYTELIGDHHLKTRAAEYRAMHDIRGTILGLVAEESRARRMTTAKGWLRWADGSWRCTPLRKWTWRDIAGYHAANDLPCLSAYRKFGFEARTSAGLGGHAEKGIDAIAPSKARLYGSNAELSNGNGPVSAPKKIAQCAKINVDALRPMCEDHRVMKNQAIFDNGGGITLQLGDYAHHYSDPEQAATDWAVFQKTKDTAGWEGHEEEAAELDPSHDEIRNGGYRVMDADDITKMIEACEEETGWNNIDSFVAAVAESK